MAATAPAPYQDSRWQADSAIEAAAAVRVELGAEEVAGANGEPAAHPAGNEKMASA